MELGGKSALVVCADADLETAVEDALLGIFLANGEVCVASLAAARALRRSTRRSSTASPRWRERFVVGHALDPETQVGPLITAAHRDRVPGTSRAPGRKAAVARLGGEPLELPGELDGGNFVAPTIFDDPSGGSRITSEEVFGPVVVVERWSDEDEVVARANATEYGLGAGVWTTELAPRPPSGGASRGGHRLGQHLVRHPVGLADGRRQGTAGSVASCPRRRCTSTAPRRRSTSA